MNASTHTSVCDRCRTPLESGDLRCSICGQAAPADIQPAAETKITILRCQGCGAAITYDPDQQLPTCSFCKSTVAIETIVDPMEQTSGYLPFTVTPDQAGQALRRWLGTLGWFRPSDLRSSAQLQELRPLWWVAWVFDADCHISWTADSDAGAGRSSWAPHAGQTSVQFRNVLASASRGLSVDEAAVVSRGLDLSVVDDSPTGAQNATIERFDVPRSEARRQVKWSLTSMAERQVQNHECPGSQFRNVRVSVVVQGLKTRRLSLPAYVLAYRYKDSTHRVVICGQNTQHLVGSAPYSYAKMVLVVLAAIALAVAVLGVLAASG
ncbi:hypothetical protein FYK55_24135 [Roseiconus nitratireducens]|uniref:Zinc ribbon domain-containing protein n=1 Tax=Roseiconus nitratireducens TaxID=2605748 RepID=A0A5M6CW22_9BACT|nr:hypothetical protein [Roseiconus nitratireducens]KAA5539428.1 hypothetical protein FYK55_24135 [Roseiconus nitratireducens]